MAVFIFGSFASIVLAGLLHIGEGGGSALRWILTALVLFTAAMVITGTVNVPLNNGIKAAGDPRSNTDPHAMRIAFNEPRWVRWNQIRAVLSGAALVLFGGSN